MKNVVPERILRHFDPVGDAECWLWRGPTLKGYGKYGGDAAHRVVFRWLRGPIPEGLELDHLCRTPLCVNPTHLEPVTRLENMRRRYADYAHCKHGHEFTEENTYRDASGRRYCRPCGRARSARYKARRSAPIGEAS